ncbi:MAG: FAD-binding protein [Leeuwenhoekiella sp.]
MATTTVHENLKWDTLHKNGAIDLKKLLTTRLDGRMQLPDEVDRYNDATVEIQRLLQEALDANEGFRAYGSRWSMSSIAQQKDNLHQNNLMNLDLNILDHDLHADTDYDYKNVYFFECGNTIKEISQELEKNGKSLKTSGASNGQTIAGCIATGVHGSAWDVGAIQDYVVGLHLITGPNPDDSIYIERASKPALNDAFAEKINAGVIRDDAMFQAAVVGLGSFGFIHGVAIEAEDLYLLNRYVRKIDKNLAIKLSETMDFKNSTFKIEGEIDADGNPLEPYHYKVFINPYVNDDKYVVEAMYKKPFRTDYPNPYSKIKGSMYRDLIYTLIKISEKFPKRIPWFIKRLEKQILPAVGTKEDTVGTLYETFWDAPYQGPAFACSFGVANTDAGRTLNILSDVTKKEGPIPGIFAMRFVKGTEATLGFTKFPITCVIEIDGVLWKKSRRLISLKDYSTKMIQALQQENIPFTLHWGKNADWEYENLNNHMFGSDTVNQWKEQRYKLLSPAMAEAFTNKFLRECHLDGLPKPIV